MWKLDVLKVNQSKILKSEKSLWQINYTKKSTEGNKEISIKINQETFISITYKISEKI